MRYALLTNNSKGKKSAIVIHIWHGIATNQRSGDKLNPSILNLEKWCSRSNKIRDFFDLNFSTVDTHTHRVRKGAYF